jgi:steroid delta-isomerase-like uncharacterized protein
MTTQSHKDLVRKYFDAMNAHDVDEVASFASDDLLNHAAIPEAQGAAGLKRIMGKLFKAFPDATWSCEEVMAEGDRVVCRVTMRGTHQGALDFLRTPMPATGRKVQGESIHVFRIDGGKLVEHWAGRDDLGMLRQLGYAPQPVQS